MKNYQNPSAGRGLQVAALLAALLLSACGGGGGNPGTTTNGSGSGGTGTGNTGGGTVVTPTPSVSLAFTTSAGGASNNLTGATPLTVKATVLDKDKKPVQNAIVTFATSDTLAIFSPSAGTALTDASGVASVTMRAASLSAAGAGAVTTTTTVADATITGTGNYAVGATALSFGTLTAKEASLPAYGTTVLSVDLLSGSGKYTDQQVNVNFSSSCITAGKATVSATVATNNGTAQTVYRDKGCANTDIVTVSSDAVAKPVNTTLTIGAPSAASVQFVGAAPAGQAIVIRGQGGNGRTETATLTYKVVDNTGAPLAGKQVNFTSSTNLVTVNKASDTTDATGSVSTTVNSGTTPTSFRVQATLPGTATGNGTDISTLSDSIVVTNGLPVQSAFSIGTETFNVEGWNINTSGTEPATHITVSLGDANGNLVPDGTPIVFQTNLGAVGTSSSGGCNTSNGSCSVDYRAQAPRSASPGLPATACNAVTPDSTRAGLATICASTSDGSKTLFAKTAVFLSGSTASNITMNGSKLSGAEVDLGTIGSSETRSFQLQISDVNLNPMPAGTRVEITSMLNGNAAAVSPATVPNIAPHSASSVDDATGATIAGNQGSFHTFRIASTQPTECKNGTQASFNVAVTTPSGAVTSIPFKLSFTCP